MDNINLNNPDIRGRLCWFKSTFKRLKTLRTRHTRDISLHMYILLTAGVALWIVYGFFISSMPLIAANIVTFLFVFPILIMKIRYK